MPPLIARLVSRLDLDDRLRPDRLKRSMLQCSMAAVVVLISLVALALGLVLNEWTSVTLLVVMAGVVLLSLLKQLVLPHLLDLS